MRVFALIKIIFILFLTPALVAAGEYQVIRVVDGDTILIDYHGTREKVRMLCVDTPESVHPDKNQNTDQGDHAAEYTHTWLDEKWVDLEFESRKRGRYGRLLAYVFINGINFNVHLVEKGWSRYYTKYGICQKYHNDFLQAERKGYGPGQLQ